MQLVADHGCLTRSAMLLRIGDILPILVQNLPADQLPRLLCSIAPVCQPWSAAVTDLADLQQLRCVDATVTAWPGALASFSAWLPHHARLLRNITISRACDEGASTTVSLQSQDTLAHALTCAAQAGMLQLQAFSSDCAGARCILQALTAAQITSLQLHLAEHSHTDPCLPSSKDLAFTFEHLTSLQSLGVCFRTRQCISRAFCRALTALTSLTNLTLGVGLESTAVGAVQDALQQLPLQRLQLHCAYVAWRGLDLQQLTQLTELQLKVPNIQGVSQGSCNIYVPCQLSVLHVRVHGIDVPGATAPEWRQALQWRPFVPVFANLTELQQLQAFSSATSLQLPQPLVQHLSKLTTLQDVSLAYNSVQAAACNRQDWAKLKHLQRLSILWADHESCVFNRPIDRAALAGVLQSVGAVTTLTSLRLNISMPPPSYWLQHSYFEGSELVPQLGDSALPLPLDVLSHLTKLTHCQELQVTLGPLPRDPAYGVLTAGHVVQVLGGSAKQLSVLTALTCLQLDHLGAAVDDAAAAALASSLTGLRHLELQGSNIEQQATVAALQRLPMLTQLQLCTEEEEAAGVRGDAGGWESDQELNG